ncbi:hypothetical protein [Nocardia suismassiliense]|nr:hypothetical protein [Nocardia suismassiliense]
MIHSRTRPDHTPVALFTFELVGTDHCERNSGAASLPGDGGLSLVGVV